MKLAAAAGFPATTAMAMTAEDVKASDSDQVTISFDISGRVKKTVDADWYDHVQRSKQVRDKIESRYFHRDGIIGVGIANDTEHYVSVILDENNPDKDDRRGELPERKKDVRIEVEEQDGNPNPAHDNVSCESHEGPCNDQTTGNSTVPGGVRAGPYFNEDCTLGPQTIPGGCKVFGRGWSLPVHCLTTCHDVMEGNDNCTSTRACEPVVQAEIFHNMTLIGRTICYDEALDFMYIEQDSTSSPEPEIVLPSDHSNKVHIKDSVGNSGLDLIMDNNDYPVSARGISSCEVKNGSVDMRDLTRSVDNYCRDEVILQVKTTFDNTHLANGDSGSVFWISDNGDNFAVTLLSNNFCAAGYPQYGPQAPSIQDRNNVWWSDQ